MPPTQLHLAFNHLPLVGMIFASVALVVSVWRPRSVEIHGLAHLLVVLAALSGVPAFMTGEAAEHALEHRADLLVSDEALGAHEELGEKAIWVVGALGVIAVALWAAGRSSESRRRPLTIALLVLTLLGVGLMGYLSHLGGQVRRPELRGEITLSGEHHGEDETEEH